MSGSPEFADFAALRGAYALRMARQIVLLRGINNRIAMLQLREALTSAGFDDVRTHLQSGNVVLSSTHRPRRVAADVERLIADRFGFDITVVVRTRAELAERGFPRRRLRPRSSHTSGASSSPWHPKGVARSKLWAQIASPRLGVTATTRNWTTVTTLLELADE